MRKLFMFNMVSLDGFFAGPNGELDWHNVDGEFNDFAIPQLDEIDTLLFGRITYELMASFWPTEEALRDDPVVAEKMNSLAKVVFSRTLARVDWNNSRLVKENAAEEVAKLKQQPGKDLALFGSANLMASLLPSGLIDEFRVMVNPVVLGSGMPLFSAIRSPLKLKLQKTRSFNNGNVLLYYEPDGEAV